MIAFLHVADIPGLQIPVWPYSLRAIPPFGVPAVLNLCFWGGLYGLVFGLVYPKLSGMMWLNGLVLGLCAVLVGFFVVPTIKGLPIGGGWMLTNWGRSILINGFFGIGVGVIYPFLSRRVLKTA